MQRRADSDVIQLREWGAEKSYPLPRTGAQDLIIGSASDAWVQVQDAEQFVSRRHAVIRRIDAAWYISDAASKNGLWIDGRRAGTSTLLPGMEVGIGRLRFVVEDAATIRERQLVERFLGWSPERRAAVDRAMRCIREYRSARVPLWLTGCDDLAAIARRIHDEVQPGQPFDVVELHGRKGKLATAMSETRAGAICTWARRMPADVHKIRALVAQCKPHCNVIVCARTADQVISVEVPSLATRTLEIERIIDEYAADAIAKLDARSASFAAVDRDWLVANPPETLAEIEETTLRLIAVREFGGVTHAAPKLGLSHSALSRWMSRRFRTALPKAAR